MHECENDPSKPSTKELHTQPAQKEVAALLRLVGILGFSVAGGIVCMFFAGMAIDKKFQLGGIGIIFGTLFGIAGSFYWAYRCIAKHLEQFAPDTKSERGPHE